MDFSGDGILVGKTNDPNQSNSIQVSTPNPHNLDIMGQRALKPEKLPNRPQRVSALS
jgi:hypothetical protein